MISWRIVVHDQDPSRIRKDRFQESVNSRNVKEKSIYNGLFFFFLRGRGSIDSLRFLRESVIPKWSSVEIDNAQAARFGGTQGVTAGRSLLPPPSPPFHSSFQGTIR